MTYHRCQNFQSVKKLDVCVQECTFHPHIYIQHTHRMTSIWGHTIINKWKICRRSDGTSVLIAKAVDNSYKEILRNGLTFEELESQNIGYFGIHLSQASSLCTVHSYGRKLLSQVPTMTVSEQKVIPNKKKRKHPKSKKKIIKERRSAQNTLHKKLFVLERLSLIQTQQELDREWDEYDAACQMDHDAYYKKNAYDAYDDYDDYYDSYEYV